MSKRLSFCLSFFLIVFALHADIIEYVMPNSIKGIKQSSISLNGEWLLKLNAKNKWHSIKVPGEIVMQGFELKHDEPALYKHKFHLPSDLKDKKIILRFDGVFSEAKLWINNKMIRNHFGGFTRWETDITPYIKYKGENELQLEIIDRLDDISYASGYAHHPIGGILRDVTLYAIPGNDLNNLQIETLLDKNNIHANLKIAFNSSSNAMIQFELLSPNGKRIELPNAIVKTQKGKNCFSFPISNPLKWDAEHPQLYTLKMKVEGNDYAPYFINKKIGFRKIEIKGNQLFVNGFPVKLRGACRHDMHPTLGRSTTRELDSLDVMLFKESNMNFVRTSHYPPSENFLEFCDKAGIYVECETAVCFANTYRQKNYAPGDSENDTTYSHWYLDQLKEMVQSLRQHTSILYWSIGNESNFGINFQKSYDWIKKEDTTRPVIFSYPGLVKQEKKCYDILSFHYPNTTGTLNQYGVSSNKFESPKYPSIFDEWAHVPCYTYSTLQNDPNIREFWGQSLDKMWSNLFESKGGLGGAIWGYIDETFMVPELKDGNPFWIDFAHTKKPAKYKGKCVGYGEWGIVDVWRRKKPEFWSTKKAYSPIRLLETSIKEFSPDVALYLPIYNRFDHTNLDEIKINYIYNNKTYNCPSISLLPHHKGLLTIPAHSWKEGDKILITFTSNGDLIDKDEITLGRVSHTYQYSKVSKQLIINESTDFLTIKGHNFILPFNKKDGLIENARINKNTIIEKGPFLNLDVLFNHKTQKSYNVKGKSFISNEKDWEKQSLSYKQFDNKVIVNLEGTLKSLQIKYTIQIYNNGKIDIDYILKNEPNGVLREAGLKFYITDKYNYLNWKRKGYWTYYPSNSFAGNEGSTSLYNSKKVKYGQKPNQPWSLDTHNYYYFADKGCSVDKPLTNMAKGMKENIYQYSLHNKKHSMTVISNNATLGCRLNKNSNNQLILYINNRWDYPEIGWGDFCKSLEVYPSYGKITLILE